MAVTPYVVGQWVREERFYGRKDLIDSILVGNRNCLWVLGTRRVGKTSLLRQLEHLAWNAEPRRYFPLFWDFQGSEQPEDLHDGFRDALLDALDRLDQLGIALTAVEDADLFTSMGRLRRELAARNLSLLLLGDEVEELVAVQERSPRFLRRLRRAFQSPENIRTVLASTIRLWLLATTETTTSPFLHGFTPPLPIRGLTDEEATALIRQSNLQEPFRPAVDDQAAAVIRERCNNHPYLLQLLSERFLEVKNLDQAIEDVASDPMVSFFFAADLGMLDSSGRRILETVAASGTATIDQLQHELGGDAMLWQRDLQRLEQLGFIRRSPQSGHCSLANHFFRRWFAALAAETPRRADADPDRPERTAPLGFDKKPSRLIDGRYELLGRLGSGASGDVYKAQDRLLRCIVAIKILSRDYCEDAETLERLRREVVLARDLSHPNILKLYHLGDDQGQRYITMQFVDGADLAKVLQTESPLSMERVLSTATKLAGALAALHRCDVLHRDIKPTNVLIDLDGEPRLSDFGLARLQSGPEVTRHGMFLGTPAYASPEQSASGRVDVRSDLYSLGVLIFEMATGRLPFVSRSAWEILQMNRELPAPSPRELRAEIPEELSRLILRCLAKDPADRFSSAAEVGAALESIARGSHVT